MITGGHSRFYLNPAVRTSPLVDGQYRLYFGDRKTSCKVSLGEWEQILDADSGNKTVQDLYQGCQSFLDSSRTEISQEEYLKWLCSSGILLIDENVLDDGEELTPDFFTDPPGAAGRNGASHRDRADGGPPVKDGKASKKVETQDPRILLYDFNWITRTQFLRPPRVLISLQAWLFPLTAFLLCFAIYSFYFSANPIGLILARNSDPLSGIARLLLMLIVINFVSMLCNMLATYALGIKNQKLYLRFRWGFLPRFASEANLKERQRRASGNEYLILIVQPLLVRAYLIIGAVFCLYVYTPIPSSSPISQTALLLAVIQGGIASSIILLLPIRNTPGRKLLEYISVLPKGYLKISAKRTSDNFSLLLKGRFREINLQKSHVRSFLFIIALLIVFCLHLFILYNVIIPGISLQVPPIAGTWTSLIVRVALTLLLVRFLYVKVFARLIAQRGSPSSRPTTAPANHRASSRPARQQASEPAVAQQAGQARTSEQAASTFSLYAIHLWFNRLFSSRRVLILILIVVFLFPFRASITGSASVTEGETLDIRSTESAYISSIYATGPSAELVKKGAKLLQLTSTALDSLKNQKEQDLINLKSDIRSANTLIQSIKYGSKKLEAKNRNEELQAAQAAVTKNKARIESIRKQIQIQNQQIATLQKLTTSGATSAFQLDTALANQAALSGELASAISDLTASQSNVSISQRQQTIDQQSSYEEQLSRAQDDLTSAQSKLQAAEIALDSINQRISKLTFVMPFNGVVSSSTTNLMNRTVTPGETLLTVKAQPLTETIALIPEYDRARVRVGLPCTLRLYSASGRSFSGTISSISPTTTEVDGLQYLQLQIQLKDSFPSNFIGSKGYAKVEVGYTSILLNIIAPLARFFSVDLWSLLP